MGKEKLESALQTKLKDNQPLFVPYIMAGDGGLDVLEERIDFLDQCGVAAIELGIPFSDPVADGPTIQEAGKRALDNGTTLQGILDVLKASKSKRTVPIILMTYMNPIYAYGVKEFSLECNESGVDGIIIPDLPLEEEGLVSELKTENIAHIRLASMTSPKTRITEITNRSEGFLYAVSVTGTTGARQSHGDHVKTYLTMLKENSTVPVLAGFGVSSVEQALDLSSYCNGVIVGSKIVDLFHRGETEEIRNLIEGTCKANVSN